jgi:hypothetical protein
MPAGTLPKTCRFRMGSDSSTSRLAPRNFSPPNISGRLIDGPLANKHFETIGHLDAAIAERYCDLAGKKSLIASHTKFHWWPKSIIVN